VRARKDTQTIDDMDKKIGGIKKITSQMKRDMH